MSDPSYDVAIIGAGDVGAAIARELARFDLRVALIDRGDVGAGTSKANTAILHTGFDSKPGTLEARLVARGHGLLLDYAQEAGIPLERTGALLVAWTDEQLARFPAIEENARANGYSRIAHVPAAELYAREPHLGPGALGALEVPDEFIICPWTAPLAWATQAHLAGVSVLRGVTVSGLRRVAEGWQVLSSAGPFHARWVVNAAGLHSDSVHAMAGLEGFTITPRRGELIVFDKLSRPLVSHVLLPVPTGRTKGVLIAPTVYGNVMLGPTAQDVTDRDDRSSTEDGIEGLRALGARMMPELLEHEVTAIYVGLRAASEHADYQLQVHEDLAYVCAGGIRSTGLTGAMGIAEWVRDGLADAGVALRERPGGLPGLRMPSIGQSQARPFQNAELIALDDAYGDVVCFCERVTRGEIRDAALSPLPPTDLDGLRRRTRVLMGRCQGFYCGARVTRELALHAGIGEDELRETPG
jgi:glycerol-3-phosphate dehydrogenase